MNTHENRNDFILSVLQIIIGAVITLVCIACGYVLFVRHVEGGAYFLGLVSGSPAAALTYQLGKAAGEKKSNPAPAPMNVSATAQAGDAPDTSSVTVATSALADTPVNS